MCQNGRRNSQIFVRTIIFPCQKWILKAVVWWTIFIIRYHVARGNFPLRVLQYCASAWTATKASAFVFGLTTGLVVFEPPQDGAIKCRFGDPLVNNDFAGSGGGIEWIPDAQPVIPQAVVNLFHDPFDIARLFDTMDNR